MPRTPHASEGIYTDTVGSLQYKLYLSTVLRRRPPLFVMLHGAGQDACDFAAGTRMHEVVEECGGVALFPEQSRHAHPMGCWNWYDTRHQFAEAGEPAMLAGLTRHIIANHDVDPTQVYVAGMSAGGAMAVILGQAYPNLYAAVGVHSGIPAGIAHDLTSALRAMNSGPPVSHSETGDRGSLRPPIPTIVFHGDRDRTVHPLNAAAVVEQALSKKSEALGGGLVLPAVETFKPGGRDVTISKHARQFGQPHAELWIVHGVGHAWTGGSSKGSYTDEAGPDASREMRRFFLDQSLARCSERNVE